METKFQIGKSGITQGVIDSLVMAFKNHRQVRISLLQASNRDKAKTKETAQNLADTLARKMNLYFSYRVIGFTIVLRKRQIPLK